MPQGGPGGVPGSGEKPENGEMPQGGPGNGDTSEKEQQGGQTQS